METTKKIMLLSTVSAVTFGLAAPVAAQVSFEGERIQIIVPFAPGGATDVAARFLESHMERHLPGNPDIEVVNRGGGGSILGANWFAQNAEPDGLTVLFTTSSTATPYVLGQEGVEYDLAEMRVAYALPFGSVTYVSQASGIETVQDLAETDTDLIYGGISAAASDLPTLLSFEVLGLDVRSVLGFEGRGPARLAFDRGETNIDFQFTPAYLTQVADQAAAGTVFPLMTGGSVGADGRLTERDPAVPDLPSVHEVYVDLNGEEPSGVEWDAYQAIGALTLSYGLTGYVPAGTPDEVIAAFAAAVEAINADPEFIEASQQVTGGYDLILPQDAEGPLKAALQPSDEVVEYLRTLLSEKFDVAF
ncbi:MULTISPECIES: tricarboxylate transporter [unclassified Yoonia]|uniref:Bug family tripartite tricarboxylate transporter substrate binding protein n=1 Tax=unclassified Yoonia TaxID=2629118 RepID=UPI002AFF98B7|nr:MULTISPECIES: tricarboxylate transporter [unclassified Yoonia]